MIDIKITSPEGGNMTGYVLNLQLFADFFFRQLGRAGKRGERVRFKAIDTQQIVIAFTDADGATLTEMTIAIPANVVGLAHALMKQVLGQEIYARMFAWASEDEKVCTMAVLERFSRLTEAEIAEMFPPETSGPAN